MTEPTVPLFFCRCAFLATPDQLWRALADDPSWHAALGGRLRDQADGARIRLDHAASGGIVELVVGARGEGSRLLVSLLAETLARPALDAFSRAVTTFFATLEARLGAAPDNLLPSAWPTVHEAPGRPPLVLRRADYVWQPISYDDAPDDLLGVYAALTAPLGVTQFGADVNRLSPGERSTRYHAELHEQEGFLVLSGTVHIEVEGHVLALEPGDFCVTFPGEAHHLYNASDAPCEFLSFGGPDVFGSGSSYPRGRDAAWREAIPSRSAES